MFILISTIVARIFFHVYVQAQVNLHFDKPNYFNTIPNLTFWDFTFMWSNWLNFLSYHFHIVCKNSFCSCSCSQSCSSSCSLISTFFTRIFHNYIHFHVQANLYVHIQNSSSLRQTLPSQCSSNAAQCYDSDSNHLSFPHWLQESITFLFLFNFIFTHFRISCNSTSVSSSHPYSLTATRSLWDSQGVLESQSPGVPESWSLGVPESRSPGVPEPWIVTLPLILHILCKLLCNFGFEQFSLFCRKFTIILIYAFCVKFWPQKLWSSKSVTLCNPRY